MSIATVVELSSEVRRLAIAGSALGSGDHRLQRLLAPLQAAGEKVPVFARLAEKTQALLQAGKSNSAVALMELNALVSAVLKTQGKTGIDGEIVPPSHARACRSQPIALSAIVDMEASLAAGGGNMREIRSASRRGYFDDIRFARHAVAALQAHSTGVADFAATRLLPVHGEAIVPMLIETLDLSSRKPAQRVLQAIHGCDAASAAALARQILDPNAEQVFDVSMQQVSIEAQASALLSLSDSDADAGLLHEHLKAKKKVLRLSALRALLKHGDAEAAAKLDAMFKGSPTRVNEALEAIDDLSNPMHREVALQRGRHYIDRLRGNDASGADINKLSQVLALCLKTPERQEIYAFLYDVVLEAEKFERVCSARNWDSMLDCASYAITACARFGEPERDLPILFNVVNRDMVLRILEDCGPAQAWEIFRHVDVKLQKFLFSNLFKYAAEIAQLPPPQDFTPQWVAMSLDNELYAFSAYLMQGLPDQVFNHIAQRNALNHLELLIALSIDPTRADELAGMNFKFKNKYKDCFERCFESVLARDWAAAIACIDEIGDTRGSHFSINRNLLATCRTTLTHQLDRGGNA